MGSTKHPRSDAGAAWDAPACRQVGEKKKEYILSKKEISLDFLVHLHQGKRTKSKIRNWQLPASLIDQLTLPLFKLPISL